MDFAATVKMARNKLKMSQEGLARALNVSYATINRWENGRTHPNKMAKQVFISFCMQHGIVIQDLMEGYVGESDAPYKKRRGGWEQ